MIGWARRNHGVAKLGWPLSFGEKEDEAID